MSEVILLDATIDKKSKFRSIRDLFFSDKDSPEVFVLSIVSNNNVTNTVFKDYKLAYHEFTHMLNDHDASIYFDSETSKEAISSDGTKIQLRTESLIGG